MPVHVSWYDLNSIILYTVSDPLTLDELENAAEEIWALTAAVRDPVDMIFDYRAVTTFPRGGLPVVREGYFALPMLDRVAMVGSEPLVEMMIITLTRATYRPDPTIHAGVEEAAAALRRMAAEDTNR
jgi:hypothetical protein